MQSGLVCRIAALGRCKSTEAISLLPTVRNRKQRDPEQQKGEALRNSTLISVTSTYAVTDRNVSLMLCAITVTSNFYPFTSDLRMCCIESPAVNYWHLLTAKTW